MLCGECYDVIISVGYRVKSQRSIEFRRWANKVLKDYIIKGYAVNDKRLDIFERIYGERDLGHYIRILFWKMDSIWEHYYNQH